jgi:hypothetical protein
MEQLITKIEIILCSLLVAILFNTKPTFYIHKNAHFTSNKQKQLIINQLRKYFSNQHSTLVQINIQHFRLAKYLQKPDCYHYFG